MPFLVIFWKITPLHIFFSKFYVFWMVNAQEMTFYERKWGKNKTSLWTYASLWTYIACTMQFHQHRARLDVRRHSFTHRIVPIWNSLSNEIVTAPSVNAFKNRLDKFWKNKEAVYNYKVGILSEDWAGKTWNKK